jgi:fatty acid desaturase
MVDRGGCSRGSWRPPSVVRPSVALIVRDRKAFFIICLEAFVGNIAIGIAVVVVVIIVIVIFVLIISRIVIVVLVIFQSLFLDLFNQLAEVVLHSQRVSNCEAVPMTSHLLGPLFNLLF